MESIKFSNSSGYPSDGNFALFLENWNNWGWRTISRLQWSTSDGKWCSLQLSSHYLYEDKPAKHTLEALRLSKFEEIPADIYTVVHDVAGAEKALLTLSPEVREELIKRLHIVFPGESMFNRLTNLSSFQKSFHRDGTLASIMPRVNECQRLLTLDLDISSMVSKFNS